MASNFRGCFRGHFREVLRKWDVVFFWGVANFSDLVVAKPAKVA